MGGCYSGSGPSELRSVSLLNGPHVEGHNVYGQSLQGALSSRRAESASANARKGCPTKKSD